MAIRIDHVKTHLPLKNVKGCFGYQNISAGIMSNIFKRSLNPEIEANVFGNPWVVNKSSTNLAFNGVSSGTMGHEVFLPVEPYKKRIEKVQLNS